MDRVSEEGSASDAENRGSGDSDRLGVFESDGSETLSDRKHGSVKNGKSERKKGQGREAGKSKESRSPVKDSMRSLFDDFAANGSVATEVGPSMEASPDRGFQVGDMVWGKVKSHPWWPGHVYSEEFANPSVRRSKREGLLLVAFFGDSSYGWFDPSELIPFDSNFAEKSRQTNSKTFVKAVEEAVDEVCRRRGLGLSCLCRNKQNFRQTGVEGFFAVDVADYEPGAVYSIDVIKKARDGFHPRLALDFVRQLALEPTSDVHAGIDFIKNKATVMSYRKATYEEVDETYAQAFGHQSDQSGSAQEPAHGKTLPRAPLSGRQVFADTSGKGKSGVKPNKPKESKKDKYLFKRRDESKEVKTPQKKKGKVTSSPQPVHVEDPLPNVGSANVLQSRVSAADEQIGTAVADAESALRDATTETSVSTEEMPVAPKPDIVAKVESPSLPDSGHLSEVKSSVAEEKKVTEDRKTNTSLVNDNPSSESKVLTQDDVPSSGPHKTVATKREDSGKEKLKVRKRPVGELGSGKSVLPEKKKKKKEMSASDSSQIPRKEGVPLGKVSSTKPAALAPKPSVEDSNRTDSKATTSSSADTGLRNSEGEIARAVNELHSLALDPFLASNRQWSVKVRQAFLRFRSLVFEKSLQNDNETNGTRAGKSSAATSATFGSENATDARPVKPPARTSVRPDDPTKSGRKRDPSDRQEDIAAKKKKKINEIRNLTTEKKQIKISHESPREDGKQTVNTTPKKVGSELIKKTEPLAPEPTMLSIRFPSGRSLPSRNELKAKLSIYGPIDPSATRVFYDTLTCKVVYTYRSHAKDAYKGVVGGNSPFGNSDLKCSLKAVGVDLEPPVNAPKEDTSTKAQPPAIDQRPPVLPEATGLKSCLKKSGSEEVGGNGGSRGPPRVKFMLAAEAESDKNMDINNIATSFGDDGGAYSFSTSHSTMDNNTSKNFQKAVPQPSLPLPLPISTSVTTTTTSSQLNRPSPSSMHYGTHIAPPLPPLPPPPTSMLYGTEVAPPTRPPPPPTSMLYGTKVSPPTRPPPPPTLTNDAHFNRPTTSNVDITQQMLSLLTKCNDVVANVTSLYGYVPYHPL